MPRRMLLLLTAVGVGVMFAVGLFLHGVVGGVLLILTDAILLGLSYGARDRLHARGQGLRLVIVLVIAALAVAKFAGHA